MTQTFSGRGFFKDIDKYFTLQTHFEVVWPVRMGWAGHKLTDIGTGKGESEGESLDNGTCSSEPASL